MKSHIFVLALVCVSLSAQAAFHGVTRKSCNGKKLALLTDERVFIDANQLVMGFGSTDDKGCRTVDFFSFVIQSANNEETTAIPVDSIGSRSSCVNGVLPGKPVFFKTALITKSSLVLHDTAKCSELVFEYKK